jgi:hypothetical protein
VSPRALLGLIVCVVAVSASSACSQSPAQQNAGASATSIAKPVNRSSFGRDWPLSAAGGMLVCRPGQQQVITFSPWAGGIYALNHAATDAGYRDIAALTTPDATTAAVSKLAARAKSLCP